MSGKGGIVQIPLLIGAVVVAMIFFSIEKIPAEVTALGLLLFMIVTGLLPADHAFDGFGSDVVIMMLGLLIMMAALERTGVTDRVGRALLQGEGRSPFQLLVMVMVASVLIGGFVSNTAATAFFLPIVLGLARRRDLSPARLLMPLAFASILASSLSLIGTSTNIVVSGLMESYGLAPLSMFELTPAGAVIAVVGLIYMALVGWRLVPDRIPEEERRPASERLYLSEILVPEDSSLVDKTLRQAALGRDLDLTVLRIVHDDGQSAFPGADTILEAGDVILVEGAREDILRVKDQAGVEIRPEAELTLPDLEEEDIVLREVILLPGSSLIWRTLKGVNFRERYGLQVLAIDRRGERLQQKLSRIHLQVADVLVVQGGRNQIRALADQNLFRVLDGGEYRRPKRERAPLAGGIFVAVLAAATVGVLELPVAMLIGAFLVLLTRCITPEEAYSRVNWQVIILIASMLGLGTAMEATGTAKFLATQVVELLGNARPVWLLSAFFGLTVLLTQPMSNQASAAVVLPVALQTAEQLNLNPRSFAIMIALAASTSFLTPLEPACLLVYGPGHYRFFDFPRVGLLLSILIYGVAALMVPWLWPVA
jgi:di/tricarboxylate transporter